MGGKSFKTGMKKFILSVNLWNSPPLELVEARSLDIFKVDIDKYLKDQAIKGDGEPAQKRLRLAQIRHAHTVLDDEAGLMDLVADSCSCFLCSGEHWQDR